MIFNNTTLWNTAFGKKNDGFDEMREELKKHFLSARNNAKELLDKIRTDFPSLTIHDITHVDGLWQVASVIAGEDYEINPLEGFILGCAFLIHDAALSYDAVGGVERLRSTIEWKDIYADYINEDTLEQKDKFYEADFQTIRLLHAKIAEKLHQQLFDRYDGSKFYVIENEPLRNHCGKIIGQIAASHHWDIEKVKAEFSIQVPAPSSYPRNWRINSRKLACLLRCADAGHIDEGRAPDYLLKLLKINGVSRNHWIAQNRLSQIDYDSNDSNKIIIASNIDFTETDFAAWNVAFDAVQVLDHEIKSSNILLSEDNKSLEFKAKCVSGAESREKLRTYIKTVGWMPCDANIHISNIETLIKNLGGEKLYGPHNQIEIVIRELIQNARDAIAARRERESKYEGRINISIKEINNKQWITIEDDGVGMSLQTIKDYFLNFGSSFWASDLAKHEYPGLRASKFRPIGTFGIGFYSVFMIASEVIVNTRKFDASLNSNVQIRFPNGLCLRPILSNLQGQDMSKSTIISCCLNTQKFQWTNFMKINPGVMNISTFSVPYSSILARLTAGLDVDVYFSAPGKEFVLVHRNINSKELNVNQWIKDISYASFHEDNKYITYIDNNIERLRHVIYNNQIIGYAALNTLYQSHPSFLGVLTIGGLDAKNVNNGSEDFIGYISTTAVTAKRDGDQLVLTEMMKGWAKEQYELLVKRGLSNIDRLKLPYIVNKYGINMTNELYVRFFDRNSQIWQTDLEKLLIILKTNKHRLILPLLDYDDNRISTYIDYERTIKLINNKEYLFIPEINSNFLNIKETENDPNIFICIKQKAKSLGFILTTRIEENKVNLSVSGYSKGFIIEIE